MPSTDRRTLFSFWAAAGLILLAALVGCRSKPSSHPVYVEGVPEKGAALFYGAKHCGLCHAVNGVGGRMAPDLSGKRPAPPAVGWLVSMLWNHQPGMARQMRGSRAGYPSLSQEEMAHILAFLYQTETVDSPGNGALGSRVFESKGCVRCHSVRSVGGTSAPDLSSLAGGGSVAWTAAMWNHAQSMIEPLTKELGAWPQFSGTEMNNLIAYVSAGRPRKPDVHGSVARGSEVFKKNCIRCHTVNGDGGHVVGPSLGPETDLPLSPAQFSSVLWNHAPAMLRQVKDQGIEAPKLQTAEISDLLAFLASLRYVEPPGSVEAGEHVFADRGCAHCHGAKAEGGSMGPALRAHGKPYTAVSFATTMWSHGPKMQARAEEMGMSWPVLQASDVGNFVSFLNSR